MFIMKLEVWFKTIMIIHPGATALLYIMPPCDVQTGILANLVEVPGCPNALTPAYPFFSTRNHLVAEP